MRKIFIYASVVGLAAGVVYLLCKKEKSNNEASKSVSNRDNFKAKEEKSIQESDSVDEMYHDKNESVQSVSERHFEASEIMKDAYSNIMENFVEDFFDKKNETKEVVVDSESVSVMKEIDLISDELDDLLK